MDLSLVIFDCDGTLVDSEPISVKIDVEILNELGWSVTHDEVVERFVGKAHTDYIAGVRAALPHLPDDWHLQYTSRYHQAYESELKAIDGVAEMLEMLDIPICVASNSSRDHLERVLRVTGLAHHFDDRVYSAHDVERGKPAPDLFLHAAQQMGVDPAGCVVIEDSPAGVEAAQSAGMRVLVYAGTIVPRERFPADVEWFSGMRELPKLVKAPD